MEKLKNPFKFVTESTVYYTTALKECVGWKLHVGNKKHFKQITCNSLLYMYM